jgi:hypothetical protein
MKSLSVTIAVIAALGLFAYTNPKMLDFEQYIHAQIIQKSEKKDEVSKVVGTLLGGFTSSLIANATTRSDYVFFSIYDATLDGDEIKVLGALNNFMVLKRSNTENRKRE